MIVRLGPVEVVRVCDELVLVSVGYLAETKQIVQESPLQKTTPEAKSAPRVAVPNTVSVSNNC